MKREELEIGDWVMNLYANKPSRVIGLRTMFQDTYEISAVSDDTQYILIEDNKELHNFEPIPLTPEILVKNGFTQVGGGDSPLWEYDNFAMVKICDEWKIRVVTFLATTYTVRYVHELQQVMRKICDNKYIDNQIFL